MRTSITRLGVITAAIAGALIALPAAANAETVVTPTNIGQCHKVSPYDSALAPGQTSVGSFTTDANGVQHLASAFPGWMGCSEAAL